MTAQRRPQPKRRRRPNNKAKAIDIWRPVAPLPEPQPIVPAGDPTALLRSLGDPPLQGPGGGAAIAIAAVVDRAAGLATALAAAAGLLAEPGDE